MSQAIKNDNLALPEGGLPQVISPYIKKLIDETGGPNGPIGLQFIAQPEKELQNHNVTKMNPQEEYKYESEIAPGLIYKYKGKLTTSGEVEYYGRALWTISRFCATYCRFCFRGRVVGLPANQSRKTGEAIAQRPYLNDEDIEKVIQFLKGHREINEVILSGGDPLVVPENYFYNIIERLTQLQTRGDLDIIRIHTRAPITNPFLMQDWHYQAISHIKYPYIVLHINHPAELTLEVRKVIERLQNESHAILLSQSVLLRGVNDNAKTLLTLFNQLTKIGIRPYYLHYNDPVYWAEHFTVPFTEAIKLWQSLRPKLSGLAASVKFVIDTPHGLGKVTIPEAGWNVDYSIYKDFINEPKKSPK